MAPCKASDFTDNRLWRTALEGAAQSGIPVTDFRSQQLGLAVTFPSVPDSGRGGGLRLNCVMNCVICDYAERDQDLS